MVSKAALDEQVAAVDKMESLTEQLDADVSEVATDISLMDATLASCFSEVTTLHGAVGSLELVRFHIIRKSRIQIVGKSQSCMASKLRIIRKQTLKHSAKSLLQTSRSGRRSLKNVGKSQSCMVLNGR